MVCVLSKLVKYTKNRQVIWQLTTRTSREKKVNSFTCTLYEQHLFQSVCLLRKCFFRIKDSFIGFQLLLKV